MFKSIIYENLFYSCDVTRLELCRIFRYIKYIYKYTSDILNSLSDLSIIINNGQILNFLEIISITKDDKYFLCFLGITKKKIVERSLFLQRHLLRLKIINNYYFWQKDTSWNHQKGFFHVPVSNGKLILSRAIFFLVLSYNAAI